MSERTAIDILKEQIAESNLARVVASLAVITLPKTRNAAEWTVIPNEFRYELGEVEYIIRRVGDSYADDKWNLIEDGDIRRVVVMENVPFSECIARVAYEVSIY